MAGYSSLKSKYDNFLSPDFSIKIDGNDIKKSFGIDNLSIDVGIGETAGACRFFIGQILNADSTAILSDIQSSLSLGKKAKVSLGYVGNLTEVFFGYIANLSFELSKMPGLSVTCLDARALMRANKTVKVLTGKNEKTAIDEILNKYTKVLPNGNENSLEFLLKDIDITLNQDDLSYIMTETEKCGFIFYIDNGKAYIKNKSSETCVEFDCGEYDISLSMDYLDSKFKCFGCNPADGEAHNSEAEAKQAGKQEDLMSSVFQYTIAPCFLKEAGEKLVKARAANEKRVVQTGRVECSGLPEIAVGKKVKFNKFPLKSYTNKDEFLVTSVSHIINDNGFKTAFDISLT